MITKQPTTMTPARKKISNIALKNIISDMVDAPTAEWQSDKIVSLVNGDVNCELKMAQNKRKSTAPCMILFCAFEQLHYFIELGKRYGFNHYIPLVFRKNFSSQVLKANMKIVGCCEYGLVLYKDKLPKFNNEGRMIFNCIDWVRDNDTPKVHPTQKPVQLLKYLIEIFTDKGDVVIDPCAGSGSTLLASAQCGRRAYGFEIKKDFFKDANEKVLKLIQPQLF